jgi:N-acetylglutamate synthase/N-acetylornithine aminotransferase
MPPTQKPSPCATASFAYVSVVMIASAAAGSAKFNGGFADLDPDRLSISIDRVPVFVEGAPTGDEPALADGSCAIEIDLGLGDGAATYLTTDLSYDYVKINAEYRT